MSEVANGDLALFLNGSQKGALIVDFEHEDTMLVGCSEGGAVDCAVGRGGSREEWNPVEGRKHAEFELEVVVCRDGEGRVVCTIVLADFDGEFLQHFVSYEGINPSGKIK